MTLAIPTHLVDTMGSATAAGVEAAGHLLQDVGHAVNSAATATTGRYRKFARSVRRSRGSSTVARNLVVLGALAALAAVVVVARRSSTSPTAAEMPAPSGADKPAADMNPSDKKSSDKKSSATKSSSDDKRAATDNAHASN